MADVNIIISREEYTELLTLKIKTELEAQHKAELEELKAQLNTEIASLTERLDKALESSDYWYREYLRINEVRVKLEHEIAEMEKLSGTSKGAE